MSGDPEIRMTAYYYATVHGLPCNLEYLTELGLQTTRRARWLGIPEAKVIEGPLWVHTWPELVWDSIARRDGPVLVPASWCPPAPQQYPPQEDPERRAAYGIMDPGAELRTGVDIYRRLDCDPAAHAYGTGTCEECRIAQGGEPDLPTSRNIDTYRDGPEAHRGFWSYPPPPEDTQAYADWTRMAGDEDRDGDWLPGGWDPGWPPQSSEDM
jgi:hypothetical protein